MSVRINLLPEATKQRDRAAHQRSLVALAGVVFLAAFGGVYLLQSSQVSSAEDALLAEQQRSSELRGEEAELFTFMELANRRDAADETLVAALSDEVSFAGILQDVAMVMPTDTQLESLTLQLQATPDEATTSIGSFNVTGKTLTSHAPGVERVLLSLGKVASFEDIYLSSSSLDESDERVASFSLDGQLGAHSTTDRYERGLPENLR